MLPLRTAALAALFASAAGFGALAAPTAQSLDVQSMDRTVRPGDDFYRYAHGTWIRTTTIPAGQAGFGPRDVVTKTINDRVRKIVQDAAAAPAAAGPTRKIGDYYASVMDEAAIEAKGMAPLAADMAAISAISDKAALAAYLGTTLNSEVEGLTGNGDHVLAIWINQGFDDADHNLPHVWQGGLGMADRETYLDPSPKSAELRAKYEAHVAAVLKLAGVADPQAKAARILALEIGLAKAHAPDSEALDVSKQNNPWKRADFDRKAPGMDWTAYFKTAGLSGQSDFLVWQPSAVTGTAALVASEDLTVWKDYLKVHLLDEYAAVLPKAVADEHSAYFGAAPPRAEAAITATSAALNHAVAQIYMRQWFSADDRAKAQAMAASLISAWRGRITHATWMSPPTKEKALQKLAAFQIGLGYPDAWIDYSSLNVVRGDAFGNLGRAQAFIRSRNLARLKQPVYPIDWPMSPQAAGGVILFSPNAEMFGAGVLQPPFFDPHGDAAYNYGSFGVSIAHEIGHSFDELGNLYDTHGRLAAQWTEEDRDRFHARAAKVAAQFAAYCPLPGLCGDGKLALSENIADLAGLVVAHDAYVASLKGKPDVVIAGLTGEQRFFLGFAHRWRRVQTEAALRQQIATDIHPPVDYHVNTVRNLDTWYSAFDVKPGDKLYLKPEDRVGLW